MSVFPNDLMREEMDILLVGKIWESLQWNDKIIAQAVALNNDVIGMFLHEPAPDMCNHKIWIVIKSNVRILQISITLRKYWILKHDFSLSKFREFPGTKDIPVIAITGMIDHFTAEDIQGLGAREILLKPFNLELFMKAVKASLTES